MLFDLALGDGISGKICCVWFCSCLHLVNIDLGDGCWLILLDLGSLGFRFYAFHVSSGFAECLSIGLVGFLCGWWV